PPVGEGKILWASLSAAGVFLFVFMLIWHVAHRRRQIYASRLKVINEKELLSLEGRTDLSLKGKSLFPDGSNYLETGHPYAYDLDIFEKNSLFQLLNRTACLSGEALLAKRLTL